MKYWVRISSREYVCYSADDESMIMSQVNIGALDLNVCAQLCSLCVYSLIISWQQRIHARLIDPDMHDVFYVLLWSALLLYCYLRWSQRPLEWDWWLGTPLVSCLCSHGQTNGIS